MKKLSIKSNHPLLRNRTAVNTDGTVTEKILGLPADKVPGSKIPENKTGGYIHTENFLGADPGEERPPPEVLIDCASVLGCEHDVVKEVVQWLNAHGKHTSSKKFSRLKPDDDELYRLARHYSPVIYQHVDVRDDEGGRDGRADLILPFDYDGNWIGADNWENLNAGNWERYSDKNLAATVYYSVAQTTNYWFIYYAIFHPRDWTTHTDLVAGFLEHENDMEAISLMIHKGSGFLVI